MGLMTINVREEGGGSNNAIVTTSILESSNCMEKRIVTLTGDNYYYEMQYRIYGENVSALISVKDYDGNDAPLSGYINESGVPFFVDLMSFVSPSSPANTTELKVMFEIFDQEGGELIWAHNVKRMSTNKRCITLDDM